MKKSVLAALGGSLLLASNTFAEPIIYISASRTPDPSVDTAATIQIIDRREIEQSGADNVADVLRGRAGVRVSDLFGDGSNATIDMRGFGSNANSNVLIMIDGRRMNPSTDKATLYLGDLPLEQIERIEVIHGSSGVLFGNQAVGGVINIITKRAGAGPLAKLRLGVGSYDKRSAELTLSESFGNGLAMRFNGRTLHSDNYRANNTNDTINANLLLEYTHGDGRVFVEQRFLSESLETPGALFLDELAADRQQSVATYANDFLDTRSHVTRLGLEQRLSGQWQFAGELSYRDEQRDFLQSFRTFGAPLSKQQRKVWNFSPRVSGKFKTAEGNLRLTLGSDIEYTDYAIQALFPQSADQLIAAAYAQGIYPVSKGFDVSAGIRHAIVRNDIDHNVGGFGGATLNLDDSVTVGSLGLTFRPDNHWRWFARADQNYRFAKLEEHTNDVEANTGPAFTPDGVSNQRGLSLEAGFEYQHNKGSALLQFYRLTLDDELSFDASGRANVNIDQTRRLGANLSLRQQLGPTFDAGLDLDLTSGKVTAGAHNGKRIPLVPKYQLRLSGDWKASQALRIGGELLAVGEQVLDSDYANSFRKLDAYRVVNLNLRYTHGNWRFGARINNLLDNRYSEYGVIGGDTLGSGHPECVVTFQDNCPAFNPSPERNFWLSAEYRFDN